MNKNDQFVITINRELGSGGRTVGEKLAQKLQVPFYDKALVKGLEEKFNLTVEEIERLKGVKHNWWSDFQRFVMPLGGINNWPQYYKVSGSGEPELVTTEEVYAAETEMLKGMAEEGSCVIAGRTAFHVFAHHHNHLSVLIQASMEHRIRRVMEKQGISAEEAKKTIRKVDKMRENYVMKYTSKSRYDTRNYHLVICADGKTEDEMAELIMQYIG